MGGLQGTPQVHHGIGGVAAADASPARALGPFFLQVLGLLFTCQHGSVSFVLGVLDMPSILPQKTHPESSGITRTESRLLGRLTVLVPGSGKHDFVI